MNIERLFAFDVQVYGTHPPSPSHTCPGVITAYVVEGVSAQKVADREAARWSGSLRVGSVGVWAVDRKHGHASASVGDTAA